MHDYWPLLGGAFPFLVAIVFLRKQVILRKSGVRTTGVIVDVKREITTTSDDRGYGYGINFRPIVQFTTNDGQQIVWKCSESGLFWKNAQGKQMQIIYDPQNPQRVIRNHWSGYAVIVLLCFMSAVFIVPFFIGAGR